MRNDISFIAAFLTLLAILLIEVSPVLMLIAFAVIWGGCYFASSVLVKD